MESNGSLNETRAVSDVTQLLLLTKEAEQREKQDREWQVRADRLTEAISDFWGNECIEKMKEGLEAEQKEDAAIRETWRKFTRFAVERGFRREGDPYIGKPYSERTAAAINAYLGDIPLSQVPKADKYIRGQISALIGHPSYDPVVLAQVAQARAEIKSKTPKSTSQKEST
jgi:hypothetical protein